MGACLAFVGQPTPVDRSDQCHPCQLAEPAAVCALQSVVARLPAANIRAERGTGPLAIPPSAHAGAGACVPCVPRLLRRRAAVPRNGTCRAAPDCVAVGSQDGLPSGRCESRRCGGRAPHLKALLPHLAAVVAHSQQNKMSLENLQTCLPGVLPLRVRRCHCASADCIVAVIVAALRTTRRQVGRNPSWQVWSNLQGVSNAILTL